MEEDQNFSDGKKRPPPGEKEKFLRSLGKEVVGILLLFPCCGLGAAVLLVRVSEQLQKRKNAKDKSRGTSAADQTKMQTEMTPAFAQDDDEEQEETQAQKEARLLQFSTEEELDSLGGIQQMVITEYSGMSNFKWAITQAFSLAMYQILIVEPKEVNVCVLGKTGRIFVVRRTPLNPSAEAARVLRFAGGCIIMLSTFAYINGRFLERALFLAIEYPNPKTEASFEKLKPIAMLIEGKVISVAFGVCAVLWWLAFSYFKLFLKTWGSSDEKNYYESDTASCAQYFRSGVKSAPFTKPVRVGGMRIFFGPYPLPNIWWELGSDFHFLKCLEPISKLPVEYENGGYPSSGNGSPSGPDDQINFLQTGLQAINSFLGTLGLFFFGVNMYNLALNLSNCPTSTVLQPCIVSDICFAVARSPWFVHHLLQNKLMTAEELARESLSTDIPIEKLAKWLGVETVGQAKEQILDIAQSACSEMYDELVDSPNSSLDSVVSDWAGKQHAAYYMEQMNKRNLNISWQSSMYSCHGCVRSMTLFYFTDVQNLIELFEIFMLVLASYVGGLLAALLSNALANTPMINVQFQADPGSAQGGSMKQTEVDCLSMIGSIFFFRYYYSGIPDQMERLEEGIRKNMQKNEIDTTKLPDPWRLEEKATEWDKYNLFDESAQFRMNVNKELLGFLEGEEVVGAWTVPPQLTTGQKQILALLAVLFVGSPIVHAIRVKRVLCAIEFIVGVGLLWAYYKYRVLKTRPQAGIILTSRRAFQLTRTPRYLGLYGWSEPLIKLDVLIHNCTLFYGQLQMEVAVPFIRKVMARVFKTPISRQGMVIAQGDMGTIKMWRLIGDTYNLMRYLSEVSFFTPLETLNVKMGRDLLEKEKHEGQFDVPDPSGSKCCCPQTPPPPLTGAGGPDTSVLDRYCKRMKGEKDVYGRRLCVRPTRCKDLLCGRGLRCALECCCCCQLDEMLSEFTVSTHRIVVEQRASQRYCRCTAIFKKTPNVRVSYLAHNKASAYVCLMPVKTITRTKIQQDFTIKLLQQGARVYQQGLMLHQKPYAVAGKQDIPIEQKLWVGHMNVVFDQLTQKQNVVGSDSEASDDTDEDEFYAELMDNAEEEEEEGYI
eukprot:TRINITY_DN47951_c0_g1_i1.p1 TRINITY_DN47951_c0_g1~~TRINITY_DN47951_c0_g1_i1.p1  ORF type:complete len:1270 (-),score=211.07 TRINITY_DN47951_c0_g1_i1:81-3404(-)